jgi:hypothetical protein
VEPDEQYDKRTLRPLGTDALNRQEVAERFLVVNFTSPTFWGKPKFTRRLIRPL